MDSKNLITNALLATNWEYSKKDYLDLISPFVLYSVYHETTNKMQYIDIPNVKRYIFKEFGLDLVDSIILCILKRNSNFFKREKLNGKECFYTVTDAYDCKNFETQRLESKKNYDYFISKMQEFLKNKFNKDFQVQKLENKLTNFVSFNFFDLLHSIDKEVSHKDNELASFLNYILNNDRDLTCILQDIVKGQMIFESIYSQNIAQAQIKQKFRNLDVYFDTTFIFYMLGYAGKSYKEYVLQIIDLLKGLGAELKCFQHNYDEVYGILHTCGMAISHGKQAELTNLDWFIENKMNSSEILVLCSNLEDNISRYLTIVDTPDFSQPLKNIDWKNFTEYLNKNIKYRNEKTLNNDVESIAAIFRLRKTDRAQTLESCNAIFVTTNKKLVRTVRDYRKNSNDMQGYCPCITEYEISNIAWLKTPSKQNEVLNKSIRFAVSVLQEHSPAFWKRFVETVDRFQKNGSITLENATELKYELYSKRNTNELIEDDDCEITLDNIRDILKRNAETQYKNLTEEVKRKEEKIEQLRQADQANADRKVARYEKIWTYLFIMFYVITFLGALGLAGCSIADLFIGMIGSPFKFVFIVEIVGVAISFFVPKVKELWNIKKTIITVVSKKVARKKKRLDEEIEKKYAE